MSQYLNDPYFAVAMFFVCGAIALAALLSSMKQGGSTYGLIFALLFAGAAAYFAPGAFAVIGGSPTP